MSDEPMGNVAFPDEFDDPVLRRALQNAPDAAVAPDWRIRRTIQQRAREAVEPRDEDISLAPMVPLWKRLLGIGGESGRSRMPWNAAFATVLVGVIVTALWQHEPVPEARLDSEAKSSAAPTAREAANTLPPEPIDTTPMPGLEPRNAAPALPPVEAPQEPSTTSVPAPTPGTSTETAAATAKPAPPAISEPAPAVVAPPKVEALPAPAPAPAPVPVRAREPKAAAADLESSSKRAEAEQAPPRAVLKLEPIPTAPAQSIAPTATPASAAKSRDSSAADQPAAGASPPAGAAAPGLPGTPGAAAAPPARAVKAAPTSTVRTEATDPPTFAALSQWTRLTIAQSGGETRSLSRAEGRELLPLIGSAAITAVGAQRFVGGAEWRLTFERDGKVLAVLELAREQVRWREGTAPPATGAPSAGSLAALVRSLAEAVAPAPRADPAPPAAPAAGSPPGATSAEAPR
ncbi:hypothetical protein QN397_04360 [Variovorax sp. RTB1]|uniref:hypothetical protein n=1 Tax=Variovorax sp. RTB1 TaxID=3048631 RepID=UPI002B226223|nr:hypothetical protein [Variovorax sp. RTB1]MEB0110586.1 hypothetical protein [Variovorax sp. RTB1]